MTDEELVAFAAKTLEEGMAATRNRSYHPVLRTMLLAMRRIARRLSALEEDVLLHPTAPAPRARSPKQTAELEVRQGSLDFDAPPPRDRSTDRRRNHSAERQARTERQRDVDERDAA